MSHQLPPGGGFDWNEMVQEVAEVEEIRSHQPKPGATFVSAGKYLLIAFVLCLLIGNVVVRGFLPQYVGTGLNATTLALLIPVWTVGAIGLLALLVGQVIGWRARRRRGSNVPSE